MVFVRYDGYYIFLGTKLETHSPIEFQTGVMQKLSWSYGIREAEAHFVAGGETDAILVPRSSFPPNFDIFWGNNSHRMCPFKGSTLWCFHLSAQTERATTPSPLFKQPTFQHSDRELVDYTTVFEAAQSRCHSPTLDSLAKENQIINPKPMRCKIQFSNRKRLNM